MQNNTAIFETLFDRNFSDTGNVEFLEKITKAHPYFSPAQFYLLQQTSTGTEAFDKQAVKTNILFNNSHWLHFQLQQTSAQTEVEEIAVIEEIKKAEPAMEIINEAPDDTDEVVQMEEEIEPMKIELKMPPERTLSNEAMLFEPMHMVDYFASQGIKLSEETQTADKLGKQLKSFTEWLKTMKKVHVENSADLNVKTDDNIQTLAENSNAQAEVLTESMAEVFAKQGKMDKAGEVYEKLSLLNPAKSAYFAAKIENLKGI